MDKKKYEQNIKQIIDWFLSDTMQLFDLVLDDSDVDPQFSAVTAMNRLGLYLSCIGNVSASEENILEYLECSGYSIADLEVFLSKYKREIERYG